MRGEDDAMNAPAPKFMIETAWHGRIFTTGWTPANGGGLDVLERQCRRRGARGGGSAVAAAGLGGNAV
jgi:hypothetical protein